MMFKVSRQKGQNFVEFALVLPLLLMLILGVIDLGYALYMANVANRLSREGANLASRIGTSSEDLRGIITGLLQSVPSSLDMPNHGMIYLSLLSVDGGRAKLETRVTSSGPAGRLPSRLGTTRVGDNVDPQALSRLLNNESLNDKEEVAVVEVLYEYVPITPIGRFFQNSLFDQPLKMYSVATFFRVSIPTPSGP